jgi:hypothetical protein
MRTFNPMRTGRFAQLTAPSPTLSWGDPIQLAPYREYAAMQDSADVWNETTLNQFSAFLADEIPRALKRSQAG